MEDIEKIIKIGLTEQQAKIYLKLLEFGPNSVGEITKKIDISRISCYDSLNRLISKGLVSFSIFKKKRLYGAADPLEILRLVKEKEKEAKKQTNIVKEMLPHLNKIKSSKDSYDEEAITYKTKEGIKSIFELMLRIKKPILILGATGKALKNMEFYFPTWHKKRSKMKISTKTIFNPELKGKKITKMPLTKIKFLPKEYSSPSTLFIFGDYVVTLLWSEVPLAFLIKSKEISESYKNYFNMIWKIAKE